MSHSRLTLVRTLAFLVVSLGLVYIGWRWTSSVAWGAWWIAVPLVIAETYSLGESVLYSLTMWNARRRPAPPQAVPGRTVDVFITTYNEPLELVVKTAIAAKQVDYPHETWILDDGNRPAFAEAARQIGVGYITRGPEWSGRKRFAKAGNVNNALFKTTGEFIAILDADQVPQPNFLRAVLGYFDDPEVAFVQTPQEFWNVAKADVLGSRAELFYGPIQQGKDGWGAAFFCGSNAVLRRESLMALGLTQFSEATIGTARASFRHAANMMRRMQTRIGQHDPASAEVVTIAFAAVQRAQARFRRGEALSELGFKLEQDFKQAIAANPGASREVVDEIRVLLDSLEVAQTNQGLAVHPIDTSSITEDMATAMRLHALGWSSVYHDEVLVHGLAPEDAGSMLAQRLRWATGSMQVFFTKNPLFIKGLTLAQRLMYFATMTSYLNGFAAIVYISAPIVFLTTGVFPLQASPITFFVYFLPFFLCCQALIQVTGARSRGLWRGQQMSFSLFPVWIAATISGALAAIFGREIKFSVTAKTRQDTGAGYRHVAPQLTAMGLLAAASIVGVVRVALGASDTIFATALTLVWVVSDFALLGIAIRIARYRGPGDAVVDPTDSSIVAEATAVARRVESGIEAPHSRAPMLAYEAVAVTPSNETAQASPKLHVVTNAASDTKQEGEPAAVAVDRARLAWQQIDAKRLDAHAVLQLKSSVARALTAGTTIVLVNVSAVSAVTPSGVAGLVDLLRHVRSAGGDLRLYGTSSAVDLAHVSLNLTPFTRVYAGSVDAVLQRSA